MLTVCVDGLMMAARKGVRERSSPAGPWRAQVVVVVSEDEDEDEDEVMIWIGVSLRGAVAGCTVKFSMPRRWEVGRGTMGRLFHGSLELWLVSL
jgi:hypothetical protein